MKRSLYTKLLFWLLSITLGSILLLAVINFYSLSKKSEIDELVQNVNNLQLLCFKDFKIHNDFLSQECINPHFFITGESNYIVQNKVIDDSIKTLFNQIYENDLTLKSGGKPYVSLVRQYYESYEIIFDSLKCQLLKRGFKDWGIEGKMRVYAHKLEQFDDVDKVTVLQLRRREKDFIIRLDTSYVSQVESYAQKIFDDASHSSTKGDSIKICAQLYKTYFDSLVIYELRLGLKNQSGLKKKADNVSVMLYNEIRFIVGLFQKQQQIVYFQLLLYYAIILLLFILLCVIFSFYIARKISKPFNQLSIHIENFVLSNFCLEDKLIIENASSEVQILNKNFSKMQAEIIDYLNYFKVKVEERTNEISQQLEEIQRQKEMIYNQKKIVDLHNKNMTDSIKYALRIQQAMLPDEDSVGKMIPNSFILYKPKDIVSGDFYFVDIVNVLGVDNLFFIAADGTGHGVPGAFMSLLGLNNINRTIYGLSESKPQVILSVLNHALVQTLRKKHNKCIVTDSMDVAFCKIDLKNRKMEFVGANRPCYIIRQNELIDIKGDRLSIGAESVLSLESKLTSHFIDLESGDCIYIFTDGFCDQFGGNANKKFKKKDFVEILKTIHSKEMHEQKAILDLVFENWKGNESQTDDMLIMGFRID